MRLSEMGKLYDRRMGNYIKQGEKKEKKRKKKQFLSEITFY